MSASLRSRREGSPVRPRRCSVTMTPTGPPSSDLLKPWTPRASRRMPHSGSSAISTSAIRLLVDGSHPGNSMPAALRIRLRPPSHPTRYSARNDWPSETSTSTPVSSCDFATPVSVGSGFGRHYAARPGACRKPPVRYILEVERSGCSSFHSPSAVDGQPPREAAAYGDTSAQEDLLSAYGCSRGARSSSPSSARPARTSWRAPPFSQSFSPFAEALKAWREDVEKARAAGRDETVARIEEKIRK